MSDEADDIWNLMFSDGPARDHELSDAGHTFLGAGAHDGKETHVFQKKGSALKESPVQFLVLINSSNVALTFEQRYRVYNELDKALAWAEENGYDNMFPVNEKVGILNSVQCGDLEVSIMAVQATK